LKKRRMISESRLIGYKGRKMQDARAKVEAW